MREGKYVCAKKDVNAQKKMQTCKGKSAQGKMQ